MSTDAPEGAGRSATFGEELRKEREIRGISLKEIADSTKISKRYLELIEKNDFDSLPAPVFTRGFVREYARYLGLNSDEMVNRYIHFIDSVPPPDEPTLSRSRTITTRSSRVPQEAPRANWVVPGLIALVIGLIALAFFFYLRGRSVPAPAARASSAPSADDSTAATNPPPAPASTVGNPASTRLTLQLTATEKVWVTLSVDDETVLNEVLSPGAQREFQADNEFRFKTIGNAAGVSLTLNGQAIPPLGSTGEVIRNRVFNRDNLSNSQTPPVNQG